MEEVWVGINSMEVWDLKGWLKKFFEKLANANKESFGNERLDCCKLGRKKVS